MRKVRRLMTGDEVIKAIGRPVKIEVVRKVEREDGLSADLVVKWFYPQLALTLERKETGGITAYRVVRVRRL